jgi:hypothetical protein
MGWDVGSGRTRLIACTYTAPSIRCERNIDKSLIIQSFSLACLEQMFVGRFPANQPASGAAISAQKTRNLLAESRRHPFLFFGSSASSYPPRLILRQVDQPRHYPSTQPSLGVDCRSGSRRYRFPLGFPLRCLFCPPTALGSTRPTPTPPPNHSSTRFFAQSRSALVNALSTSDHRITSPSRHPTLMRQPANPTAAGHYFFVE